MYVAYEYISTNGNRITGICPIEDKMSHARVLASGSLTECQSYLYPNGDANENTHSAAIPFMPKY